ncbi:MAG: DUF4166 domain-containing protein [Xanthomonadales bacterium]|nr:DUF4166 domain-containing protein [Xanthomonadales bacterium]
MTLYRDVLGKEFDKLDAPVQRLHSLQGGHRLTGTCTIIGAERRIGRCLSALLGLPLPAQAGPFTFEIDANDGHETWIRHFPRRSMRSRLYQLAISRLGEQIGPARLTFRLENRDGELHLHLQHIRVFGVPWPTRWLPRIWAVERGEDTRFHFDVGADLGRFGLLVAYAGHLELPTPEANA